jgi:hypothetical protein
MEQGTIAVKIYLIFDGSGTCRKHPNPENTPKAED